jgi:hypothetical protein
VLAAGALGGALGALLAVLLSPAPGPPARSDGSTRRLEEEIAALREEVALLRAHRAPAAGEPAPVQAAADGGAAPLEAVRERAAPAPRAAPSSGAEESPYAELLRRPTDENALRAVDMNEARSVYALRTCAEILRAFGRPTSTSAGSGNTVLEYRWQDVRGGEHWLQLVLVDGLVWSVSGR